MSIFKDALNDASGLQQQLLGPDYAYYANIQPPQALGMSDKGDLPTLAKDVNGLMSYVQLLVEGSGKASKTGQPLGNRFFLKTGATCLDATNATQDRYVYIDNVPSGNIPFISSALGQNFKDFRGLIPGTLSDLNVLNPYSLMQSFMAGSNPKCQQVTLQTIDSNNNKSKESHYVTLVDLQNMDACSFPDGKNPITGKKCKSGFKSMTTLPADPMLQCYLAGGALVGLLVIYRMSQH